MTGNGTATSSSLLAAALVVAAVACSPDRDYGPIARPEYDPAPVVVVTIDTLRADRLGCYGYFRDTSPYIDRFASESVVFDNAVTLMSTTLPAHVSLWTSMYPLQTGVLTNEAKAARAHGSRARYFAEILQELGYTTAGFVSATPVKSYTGIDAGFSVYDEPPRGQSQRPADVTTDRALEWLDGVSDDAPFFLWVHYFDPHDPYEPPAPFDEAFRGDRGLEQYFETIGHPHPADPEWVEMNDMYDGEVRFTDSQVERLLEALRERGFYDRATIVLTADHGEGLGQHDWKGHGHIWNEQLFVPLIIKYPVDSGLVPGRRPYLVSLLDVVPTLVDSLGIPVPADARSQMVGDNVVAGPPGREMTFVQRTAKQRVRAWGEGQQFGLISTDWKYVHSTHAADELYDMRSDRHELENLVAAEPGTAETLRLSTLEQFEILSAGSPALDVIGGFSPEVIEELRALGYVQ
jgi:arylsulfatase A-like enzyme